SSNAYGIGQSCSRTNCAIRAGESAGWLSGLLELIARKRTPRGPYSSATARRRGFHAITYGQWLQVWISTVAGGACSAGTVCVTPSVSVSENDGTVSPIPKVVAVSAIH